MRYSRVTIVLLVILLIAGGTFLVLDKIVFNHTAIPEIKLIGEDTETIEALSEFTDPGAVATVRGEKPLNDIKVEGTVDTQIPGEYKIIYTITNNKGKHEQSVFRTVIVVDTTPPEITLAGNNPITITIGKDYKENGATATDNVDGDITAAIEIEAAVDTNTIGDYNVIYRAKDSSGNMAEVTRQVSVMRKPPSGKTIFLSFDDGPSKITGEILDILKANNAKATFFVIGSELDTYADVIKRAHNEGHAIALHSNTHKYEKIYASDEAFWKDLDTLSDRVEKITGEKSRLIRFPGGTSNTVSKSYSQGIMTRLADQAHERGYKIYDWSIDSGDANANSVPASTIAANVIKGMSRNNSPAIVLLHDARIKQTTADSLHEILKWGKNNGYTFEAMDTSIPEIIQRITN